MSDDHSAAREKLNEIEKYVPGGSEPRGALLKMAKLGAVIDEWMVQTDCRISVIQCWTSLEEFFGVVPCTVMSDDYYLWCDRLGLRAGTHPGWSVRRALGCHRRRRAIGRRGQCRGHFHLHHRHQ